CCVRSNGGRDNLLESRSRCRSPRIQIAAGLPNNTLQSSYHKSLTMPAETTAFCRVHQNLDFAKDEPCLDVVTTEKASLLKGCSHGPVGRRLGVKSSAERAGHRPVATAFVKSLG